MTALEEAEAYLAARKTQQSPDLTTLSDEEIIRHLPDEVLLQHIQSQQSQSVAQAPPRTLTPFNFPDVVSEFTRQRVQAPLEAVRQTPLGALTIPPRLPEDIARTVGTTVSLPFDPATYAFGAVGTVPNRILRMALGAGAGGLTSALRNPRASAGEAALGTVAGGVGSGLTRVTPKGVRFEPPQRPRPVEFLKGNQNRIAQAEAQLDEAATKAVHRLRRRGDLHDRVFETLSREGDIAWKPMKDVASSIPGRIEVNDVRTAGAAFLQNEPERLQALNLFLDTLATPDKPYLLPKSGRIFSQSASDWSDLSSEIGMFMTRAGIRGKSARTFADVLKSDIRNVIASTLEAKAPLEKKGFVAAAKNNWADYAADRDRLFQAFGPVMSPNASAKTGATLLKKAALGQLSYDEQQFMGRLKQASGIDLPEFIKPIAQQMLKEQRKGAIGRKVLKAGGLIGGGTILKSVLGD